jgi:hypothetical protein
MVGGHLDHDLQRVIQDRSLSQTAAHLRVSPKAWMLLLRPALLPQRKKEPEHANQGSPMPF